MLHLIFFFVEEGQGEREGDSVQTLPLLLSRVHQRNYAKTGTTQQNDLSSLHSSRGGYTELDISLRRNGYGPRGYWREAGWEKDWKEVTNIEKQIGAVEEPTHSEQEGENERKKGDRIDKTCMMYRSVALFLGLEDNGRLNDVTASYPNLKVCLRTHIKK